VKPRPRLLDLFCGAGCAATGYHRAGFDIVGIDNRPQPHYPYEFHQADALEYPLDGFDAIHASPPCQAYSILGNFALGDYPDLYNATRERLTATGRPWIIENVPGAPYRQGVTLCGSMFGLGVRRHRNFEASWLMLSPGCTHRDQGPTLTVCGHPGGVEALRRPAGTADQWRTAMGIDWMTAREITQAIPPAYTEHIGAQLLAHLSGTTTTATGRL
jgi:DNA (cytosine-5)-methyltransferase 1